MPLLFACRKNGTYQDIAFKKEKAVFKSKIMKYTDLGFMVYDPIADRVICSHQRHKPFTPASITKVATTAAALDVLGEDFRFSTLLGYTGVIRNQTLHGNLYLKGYGDPFLHARNLMRMAIALKKLGITNINGNFFFDDSFLLHIQQINEHMDTDAAYNPGVSALSSGYNSIYAHWERPSYTKSTKIFIIPNFPMYRVRAVRKIPWYSTRFSLDKIGVWTLRSTFRRNGHKRLPVKRPSLYTARQLAYLCSMEGVRIPAPARKRMPEEYTIVHRHNSPALSKLVNITLAYSDNLMAELLLLQTVKRLGKKASSLKEAGSILATFFKSKMKKINWKGLRLANGSGLTPDNRITSEQMVALLRFALRQRLTNSSYMTLLPLSGISWSLLTRLNRPQTALRVWAKAGTIYYAVTLTGVLFARSGRKFLFSVMCSDSKKRISFQKIRNLKIREKAIKRAMKWVKNKRKLIDTLVSNWVKAL